MLYDNLYEESIACFAQQSSIQSYIGYYDV